MGLLILLYLIGAILAYGRWLSHLNHEYKTGNFISKGGITSIRELLQLAFIFSWVALIAGSVDYKGECKFLQYKWED